MNGMTIDAGTGPRRARPAANLINARHSLAFQDELLDYYVGELTGDPSSESG